MSDEDRFHAYLKRHAPPIPETPRDEWQRIQSSTLTQNQRRKKIWLFISAVTLSAAGWIAFINPSALNRVEESSLEREDLSYHDSEEGEQGSYRDWLFLAEQVGEP